MRIERRPCPTREEFEHEIRPLGRPFVFTGGVDHWPASKLWTFDYLAERIGERKLVAEPGALFDCTRFNRYGNITWERRVWTTMGALAKEMRREDPAPLYVTEWRIFEDHPELAADIDLEQPGLPHPFLRVTPKCYVGPAGSFTPLHFDYAPNLTVQIRGRKRWVAYPPEQSRNVYKIPWPGRLSHFSRVTSREALTDYARFPRLRNARSVAGEVEEGDMIYMPEHWWHHVDTLAPSVSLHFFWKSMPLFAKQLLLAPVDRLFKRRPGSWVDPRRAAKLFADRVAGRPPAP